jgi:hypothetical protein
VEAEDGRAGTARPLLAAVGEWSRVMSPLVQNLGSVSESRSSVAVEENRAGNEGRSNLSPALRGGAFGLGGRLAKASW